MTLSIENEKAFLEQFPNAGRYAKSSDPDFPNFAIPLTTEITVKKPTNHASSPTREPMMTATMSMRPATRNFHQLRV